MKDIEKTIYFHFSTIKSVRALTAEIIADLSNQEIEQAISKIQNRERLLNIVFQLHKKIDGQFEELISKNPDYKDLFKSWVVQVTEWSEKETEGNDLIEEFLIKERESISQEIASIFDKKSRHKGYDLSSLK